MLIRRLGFFDVELLNVLRKYFHMLDDDEYENLQREVVKAFLRGLSRAFVEALLDAVREVHRNNIRRVADDLGWIDVGSYYKARKAGSLPSKLVALILLKYGDRVRFDPVYGEKLGILEATSLVGRKHGKCKGKLTMAQLDALIRILGSRDPIAEAEKEPSVRPWIRPFLLALMILTEEVGNGPAA